MNIQEHINLYKQFVKPNNICLDIGANIGGHTKILSQLVAPNGIVYAFEPHKPTFSKLLQLASNHIQVFNMAVSSNTSQTKLFYNTNVEEAMRQNASTIIPALAISRRLGNFTFEYVDTITIDDFCTKNNIQPNYIEIDAEGAETDIIIGGTEIITKYKPIIIMEYGYDNTICPQSVSLLFDMSYNIYTLLNRQVITQDMLPISVAHNNAIDLLAIPKE